MFEYGALVLYVAPTSALWNSRERNYPWKLRPKHWGEEYYGKLTHKLSMVLLATAAIDHPIAHEDYQ